MEFNLSDIPLALQFLLTTTIAIIIFFFLVRWSKQLETRRYSIFIYFLISTHIGPIYSRDTKEGFFELWFPLGFVGIFLYLLFSKRKHPAKMKACVLGLCVALYRLVIHYVG